MRYTATERELVNTLRATDVGDDCLEVAKSVISRSLSLPLESLTEEKMMYYISNLYTKLTEDRMIWMRNESGTTEILNDIANFKLDSVNKILCYMIGTFRSVNFDKPSKKSSDKAAQFV